MRKRREKVFIDPAKLLKALEGTSYDTAIKAPDLEIMVGVIENKSGSNRNIRTAVTELIKEGHLIGSGPKGFYMINDLLELSSYIHHLEVYIQGTRDRVKWIKRAWKHQKTGKLLLKLKKESK